MAGSCGVWVFKLPGCHPFEPACRWHDEQYAFVDWKVGTEDIDHLFYAKMLVIAGGDSSLQAQALRYFHIARTWGAIRKVLYKLGVSW